VLKFNQAQNLRTTQAAISRANKIQRWLSLAAMALVLIVLLLLAFLSNGGMAPSAQSVQAQPSPPVSKEMGQQQGRERELRVRAKLREEGYEQPFGENDQLIRQNLQLKPGQKVADFIGRSADGERWVVAESKGNDLGKAFSQLEDTANALWNKNVGATSVNTEFRIYVNEATWSKLQLSPTINGTGGYTLFEGYLGHTGEVEAVDLTLISGNKILVFLMP